MNVRAVFKPIRSYWGGGDSDPFNSGAVNALRTFQDGIGYIGGEIVGAIYGTGSGAGEIRGNEDLMDRAYMLGQRLGAE